MSHILNNKSIVDNNSKNSNKQLIIELSKSFKPLPPIKSLMNTNPYGTIPVNLTNNCTNLTEIILKNKIQFSNLHYKISLFQLPELNRIIQSNMLLTIYPRAPETITYIPYTPNNFQINLKDISIDYVYKITVDLIEKVPNTSIEHTLLESNLLFVNLIYGKLTDSSIKQLYQEKYKHNKYLSKSEKDNIREVGNEMKLRELDNFLNNDDIKHFTYEGRTYENITQFVNSKNKASKLMTDKRKKKVLFSTHTDLHFERKMQANMEENKFLKNEWFMGPIYSYDYNYKKYI